MRLIADDTWSYDEETTLPQVLKAGKSGAFLVISGGDASPQWEESLITPPEPMQVGEPA